MARLTLAISSTLLLMHGVRGATVSHSGVGSTFDAVYPSRRSFLVQGGYCSVANVSRAQNECPSGWSTAQMQLNNQNKVYCCYGSITLNNQDGYCCVHDLGSGSPVIGGDVTDSCFPFCSATSSHTQKRASVSEQCIDKVPVTATDYSERVSAASKSAAASQTTGSQPSRNSASATQGDAATSSLGSGASSSGPSATSTKSNAAVATRGGGYAGLIVAAGVMLIMW